MKVQAAYGYCCMWISSLAEEILHDEEIATHRRHMEGSSHILHVYITLRCIFCGA
jgi:uncharacterized Fe-S radical SAM superfamily protein PflX